MKKLMMLAVAVAAVMPIMAATETVGGYTWTDCIDSGVVGHHMLIIGKNNGDRE